MCRRAERTTDVALEGWRPLHARLTIHPASVVEADPVKVTLCCGGNETKNRSKSGRDVYSQNAVVPAAVKRHGGRSGSVIPGKGPPPNPHIRLSGLLPQAFNEPYIPSLAGACARAAVNELLGPQCT